MTPFNLQSRPNIAPMLSRVFGPVKQVGDPPAFVLGAARIQICEEIAFGEEWLDMGEIRLQPLRPPNQTTTLDELAEQAVRTGYYEWTLPSFGKVWEAAITLAAQRKAQLKKERADNPKRAEQGAKVEDLTEPQKDIVRRGLEAIPRIAVRCGLAHPAFDPECVAEMPWNHPITVVADTTAVHQGALDFLARHLGSRARFWIPSVVHMELQTHVNNYFERRRKGTTSPHSALMDRIQGPGG